ncbi:hypothetical protein CWO91_34265 [Bradyrhizobium genosp. SA-3]|nr:hypothetical protein CWO91_34265 [Bradyrhizobium genosp. SA-3]
MVSVPCWFSRNQPQRHCEEPLRRSNPDYLRGEILDCFAPLAMTMERQQRLTTPPSPSSSAALPRSRSTAPRSRRCHSR